MGRDIHCALEYRRDSSRDTGDWDLFCQPHISRDYHLFYALMEIAPELGVPPDAYWQTKEAAEGCDWHSHSYVTLTQFQQAIQQASVSREKQAQETFAFVTKLCEEHGKEMTQSIGNFREAYDPKPVAVLNAMQSFADVDHDARLIYWFDN